MPEELKTPDALQSGSDADVKTQYQSITKPMTFQVLDELVELQKRYARIHEEYYVCAINSNNIHLPQESFMDLAMEEMTIAPPWITEPFDHEGYSYKLTAKYKGVEIFCLVRK